MKIEYAVVSERGLRVKMEDTFCVETPFMRTKSKFLAGVFDGHGGTYTAKLASEQFPSLFKDIMVAKKLPVSDAFAQSFRIISDQRDNTRSGAAALALFVDGRRAHFASAGDCELLALSDGETRTVSKSHRIGNLDEQKRVSGLGGSFGEKHYWIPAGTGLQITRALGDPEFRPYGVIPDPEYGVLKIVSQTTLVMGTDGLFDVLPKETIQKTFLDSDSIASFAERLKELVGFAGAKDNFTFVIVSLAH